MRFYLASWIGDGTPLNPFEVPADQAQLVDLRPDETVVDGTVLIRVPEAIASPPQEWIDLGDGLDVSMPRNVSRALEEALSVTLDQFDTLRAIITELLILHGDDRPRGSRTRWRPLKETHDGMHRIILGETVYEAVVPQGATVSDDFDRADDTTLGAAWTEETADYGIDTNRAVYDGGGLSYARYDTDLNSDDHFSEALGMTVDSNAGTVAGVNLRQSSSEKTFYHARIHQDDHVRIYKAVTGTFTKIHEGSSLGLGSPWQVDFHFSFDGSSWQVKVDGVEESTGTDTSITGNLRAGIAGDTAGDPPVKAYWDSWQAQDLVTATELIGTVSASIDIARATAEEVEQLGGQSDASLDVTGSLDQSQELAGTVQGAVQATGTLTQTNELNGTVSISIQVVGQPTETEALRGQSDLSVDATGAITQTQELTGTVQTSIAATGSLTETEQLNGTVQSSIDATGTLAQTHELSGTADVSIEATGQLTQEGQNDLSGTVSTSISASGSLTQSQELSGQADSSVSTTGSLTVEGSNELAGSVSASISTTAALTVEAVNELAGTGSASISTAGALTQTHEATGSHQASIEAQGAASQTNELAGTASTSIEASVTLSQTQELGGSADTSISTSGAITIGQLADLQASLALAVGVTGALSQTQQLSQTLAQTLSVVGALKQLQEANAQARSQLQVSGALTVTQEVTRGSNGVTDALVGSIGLSESLVGTVGVADATAGNVSVSDG